MKLDANCPSDVFERVSYDAETGRFTALKSAGRRGAGSECGYSDALGYIKLCFDGKWVLAHRLAWFAVNGEWPEGEIDHINGNPSDNRICNLRVVTRRQNMRNAKGGKGWHWHSSKGKWQALIRTGNARKFLGMFNTEQEAKDAYLSAAKRYHGEHSHTLRVAPPDKPIQEDMEL